MAGIPRASSFRLTSRDHSPACPAVLATRPIPACNKSHRKCFGGDPPRFFISTYFQKTPTFLPSGPCHAKPNNHRRCCKSMAFLQMRCILPAAKQTKTKWNLPSAAWPTQHKMLSIQSPKPHLADSMPATCGTITVFSTNMPTCMRLALRRVAIVSWGNSPRHRGGLGCNT